MKINLKINIFLWILNIISGLKKVFLSRITKGLSIIKKVVSKMGNAVYMEYKGLGVEHWERIVEHWERIVEHWERFVEHWKRIVEHWKRIAEHWEGNDFYWMLFYRLLNINLIIITLKFLLVITNEVKKS